MQSFQYKFEPKQIRSRTPRKRKEQKVDESVEMRRIASSISQKSMDKEKVADALIRLAEKETKRYGISRFLRLSAPFF